MASEPILWLVVNSASGSNDQAAVAALRNALTQAGRMPARILDIQSDTLPDIAALAEAGVGVLAVFAGDGTINGLVTSLAGWDGEVLVLPGGTANLLSRTLHGDHDAAHIAASLPSLRPVRRHAVRCSQGLALIELLAGPGAVWSDVREGLRGGDIAEVAATGAEAVRQSIAGPMVLLHEPPLGRDGGYAGVRMTPDAGAIGISGYGAETFGDYLLQGLALLKRDYRDGPHDTLGRHGEVVCRSSDGAPIELMIDGERRTGGSEERFSLAELAVDLLALARHG
jgi:hypothetical protein